MKFDSNLAWKQASAAIAANREMLLALAGVFFLLPGLALALFFPAPEPVPGQSEAQAIAMVGEYYTSILPVALPMVVFQAAGTLALLTLLTDRARPTVGEAIAMGAKSIVPYILSQLLMAIAIVLIGGVVMAIGTAAGGVVAGLGLAFVIMLAAYAFIKTSLVAPVIAVEGQRNPIEALKRSWVLTRGNSVRIAMFYLLVAVVFLVIMIVVSAVVVIVLALVAEAKALAVAEAVISSSLSAIMALYFVAILAAVHRQLCGPAAKAVSETFD